MHVCRASGRSSWRWLAWCGLVFGLVWNPWWMPSGDAEVFVVVARNLLHGGGLTFNGHPVAFVPPGWPLVLSLLYRLTDAYLWLKAFQIAAMGTFLMSSYVVLRRFVRPATAGLACGMAGGALAAVPADALAAQRRIVLRRDRPDRNRGGAVG